MSDIQLPPMLPACRIAVVVPVFAEAPAILQRQLSSLTTQVGLGPGELEALYIINNGPADGSLRYQRAFAANQSILENQADWTAAAASAGGSVVTVHVVDASSPGRAIPDCNVGRARDMGLRLAAERFAQLGRNGLIVSTDADAWFAEPDLIARVTRLFAKTPTAIAAAGGRVLEITLADFAPYSRTVVKQFVTVARCRMLLLVLKGLSAEDSFRGAFAICRAAEAVAAGGYPHTNFGEDGQFGRRLLDYAADHDQIVLPPQYHWQVRVQARLSDRTGNQYEPDLKRLQVGEHIITVHPRTGKIIDLNDDTYRQLRAEVSALPPDQAAAGLLFVDKLSEIAWA